MQALLKIVAVIVFNRSMVVLWTLELVDILIDALHEGFFVEVTVDELVASRWQFIEPVEFIKFLHIMVLAVDSVDWAQVLVGSDAISCALGKDC